MGKAEDRHTTILFRLLKSERELLRVAGRITGDGMSALIREASLAAADRIFREAGAEQPEQCDE